MEPSDVKERIIDEHRELRRQIDSLEELATEALSREAQLLADLRCRATALLGTLAGHIDLEDEIVVPALREQGSDGERKADVLVKHHREQRAYLQMVLESMNGAQATPSHVANMLNELIAGLRLDMEHEEKDYLSDEALLDDLSRYMGGA